MAHHHHHHHSLLATNDPLTELAARALPLLDDAATSSTLGRPEATSAMHMHMTFYWGPDVTLLFPGWTSSTWPQFALALLFCFGLALGLEALNSARARLSARVKSRVSRGRATAARSSRSESGPDSGTPSLDSVSLPMLDAAAAVGPVTAKTGDRLILATTFCASAALSYLVMLLVMTFNVGVFLAILAGHFLGVYLFGISRLLGDEAQATEAGCHS